MRYLNDVLMSLFIIQRILPRHQYGVQKFKLYPLCRHRSCGFNAFTWVKGEIFLFRHNAGLS